jgi:hypothetical protein
MDFPVGTHSITPKFIAMSTDGKTLGVVAERLMVQVVGISRVEFSEARLHTKLCSDLKGRRNRKHRHLGEHGRKMVSKCTL